MKALNRPALNTAATKDVLATKVLRHGGSFCAFGHTVGCFLRTDHPDTKTHGISPIAYTLDERNNFKLKSYLAFPATGYRFD